jgi:hypothetical protein
MKQAEMCPEMGSVYRICVVDDTRWDVLRGESAEPVATFADKHAALAYAMSLARAPSEWQLPPGRQLRFLRSIFNQPRIHE